MENQCWRVKLYRLELGGVWNDQGTGFVSCEQIVCDDTTETPSYAGYLVIRKEENNDVLLQSVIQYEDAYERQGESIIMWRECCEVNGNEIDYALSFENTAGCYAIWDAINEVQAFPYKMPSAPPRGRERICSKPASNEHHDDSCRQWIPSTGSTGILDDDDIALTNYSGTRIGGYVSGSSTPPSFLMQDLASSYIGLPSPSVEHLEEIKDKIVSAFPSQKEVYASIIKEREGEYFNLLLSISEKSQAAGDIPTCRKVAEIIRGVVYLNDTETLEIMISNGDTFLRIAGAMEMDPLLKEIGNFRDILSRSPKGPECVVGDNFGGGVTELNGSPSRRNSGGSGGRAADTVARLFRTRLLKENMIRPLPDENGATALNSLLYSLQSSVCEHIFGDKIYLRKVLNIIDTPSSDFADSSTSCLSVDVERDFDDVSNTCESRSTLQGSYAKLRSGLCFLRELFFMSRQLSLEQRSEVYSSFLNDLRVPFFDAIRKSLCLRSTDVVSLHHPVSSSIRVMAAEILSSVALVCPYFLRQSIIEGAIPTPPYFCRKEGGSSHDQYTPGHEGPECHGVAHRNDCSLLFVVIERICCDEDAAVIEHLGETVKILLDPERFDKLDKDRFLALFYDYYVQWMLVPFAHDTISPESKCRIVPPQVSASVDDTETNRSKIFEANVSGKERTSQEEFSAISGSRRFLCEILSLCVTGHSYRMKFFIVRSNVISRVLKLLKARHKHMHIGAIKFVRAILSVKDEFYHKHIVKYDVLRPMFDLFHSICMKDNLISSAIVEILDFIRSERITTLVNYIVEKYRPIFAVCMGENQNTVDATGGKENIHQDSSSKELLFFEVFQKFLHTYDQVMELSLDFEKTQNKVSEESSLPGNIGATRKLMNKSLAEIESEEAYFLDTDSDDDHNCGEVAMNQRPTELDCEYVGSTNSDISTNDRVSNINTRKRSYFDELDNVRPVAKNSGEGNNDPIVSLNENFVCGENKDSLQLISDIYGDDNEVVNSDTQQKEMTPNEVISTTTAIPERCDDIDNSFCYSPPPGLPPLKSKYEGDDVDDEPGHRSGNEGGCAFFPLSQYSLQAGKRAVGEKGNRVTKATSSDITSVNGGVKFSIKKKSRFL